MRVVKMLGLTMATAVAAMALLGVGTASATIHLCKANEEPCAAANQYALPLNIEAQGEQGKLKDVSIFGTTEVSCHKEHVKGVVEGVSGEQLVGQITEVKWEECFKVKPNQEQTEQCTVKPIQRNTTEPEPKVNWLLHINKNSPADGSGTLYIGEHEEATEGPPGAKVACPGLPTVEFHVKQEQPGSPSTVKWLISSITGGTPAKIHINQEELADVTKLTTGFWTAEFKLTSPETAGFVTE